MPALETFEKALRFGEGRRMKRLVEQASYIATLEPDFRKLSDEDLRANATPHERKKRDRKDGAAET